MATADPVAFAGVSAGFGANIFITALDPLLAGFTQIGARIVDPNYVVPVTANWWFMIASTIVLTLVGWYVTERIVAPRTKNTFTKKTDSNKSLYAKLDIDTSMIDKVRIAEIFYQKN